jgi:predicted Zn finger-like uncharacterized protein
MPRKIKEDMLLLIRCPSCGQRFKVEDDLRDRTVECGGCEHRFKINDETIVRGRKFYPSEKKPRGLQTFKRAISSEVNTLLSQQSDRYGDLAPGQHLNSSQAELVAAVAPERVLAGFIGVLGMALIALYLIFGATSGGALEGVPLENRYMLAGFTCFMGVALLIFANRRGWFKALFIGLVLSSGLMSIPYFFRGGSPPPVELAAIQIDDSIPVAAESSDDASPETVAITLLRSRIGTGPLETEIQNLAGNSSDSQAMGVWFRSLSDSHRFIVRDYLLRVTGADVSSHFYPRRGGDYLFVLTGLKCTLRELGEVLSALGQVENIYQEISVVEVRVSSAIFIEEPIDKLSNKQSSDFYILNKKELESIDLQRVERAVQRLAEAEPKVYRDDIAHKLTELLSDRAVSFKESICNALAVWSQTPGPASDAALTLLNQIIADGKPAPLGVVSLIVKEKNPAVIPILDNLWFTTPMTWEATYGDIGPEVESTMIKRFPETKGTVRYSAVRILGRVGGADSLPLLEAVAATTDPELQILVSQAQKAIQARLAN